MYKAYKPFFQFAVHFHAEAPFDRVVNKMLEMPSNNVAALIMKLSDDNTKLQNTILLQHRINRKLYHSPTEIQKTLCPASAGLSKIRNIPL